MAIQKDTEYIGTIGNLIYYKWMNLYCIRSVPSSMRQTEASKRAALNFGKVSSRSKMLRQYFDGFIAAPRSKDMQKRLKKALLESIHFTESGAGEMTNHPLKSFRFNEVLPLAQRLGFDLQISEQAEGTFQVDIPAMNSFKLIKAPIGTSRVQVEIKVFSFSFDHDHTSGGTPAILNIPYEDATLPAITVAVNTLYEKPCIVLVVAGLSYWHQDLRLDLPGYNPAEVIGVFKF